MHEGGDRETVAVVGSGVMGSGIAQVLATSGFDVRLYDIDPAQLRLAGERIEHGRFGLRAAQRRGLLSEDEVADALSRVRYSSELSEACGGIALAIEAVPEDLALKMKVFRELDRVSPPGAVLASNSAGLPIVALALATERSPSVLGWHWAQPTAVMRLAEIVRHSETSTDAVDLVAGMARRCGKNPVVVHDNPTRWGYVANRISARVRAEADEIVREGVASSEQVDTLMRDAFRWPLGPFEARDQSSYE